MSLYSLHYDPFFTRSTKVFNHPTILYWHENFLKSLSYPRLFEQVQAEFLRPWKSEISTSEVDVGSRIRYDKDTFQADIDVQRFKPEEISIKVSGDNTITIEGKHEEKQDEHGFISRQFVRRYVLPDNCDRAKVESKLSSDGILTITAPRMDIKEMEFRSIPIQHTGQQTKNSSNDVEEKN